MVMENALLSCKLKWSSKSLKAFRHHDSYACFAFDIDQMNESILTFNRALSPGIAMFNANWEIFRITEQV